MGVTQVVRVTWHSPAVLLAGFQICLRNQSAGMWPSDCRTPGERGLSLPVARRWAR